LAKLPFISKIFKKKGKNCVRCHPVERGRQPGDKTQKANCYWVGNSVCGRLHVAASWLMQQTTFRAWNNIHLGFFFYARLLISLNAPSSPTILAFGGMKIKNLKKRRRLDPIVF
jgi:hypothetical protein